MFLNGWRIIKYPMGFVATGFICGSQKFIDNAYIQTSLLKSITVKEDRLLIKTLNSIYEARFSDMDINFCEDVDHAISELATAGQELFREAFSQKASLSR